MDKSQKQRILKNIEVVDWCILNKRFPAEAQWDIITEIYVRLGMNIPKKEYINNLWKELHNAKAEGNKQKEQKCILALKKEWEEQQPIIHQYFEKFKTIKTETDFKGNIWDIKSIGVLSYEWDN